MNKLYFYLQIIFTVCIIICVDCRTIRSPEPELLKTTSETVQSCQAAVFESLFGTEFQVPQDSNLTILIEINDNHPSLNGEPPIMKIFKDDEELEFLFPSGFGDFPIETPLVSNLEPGRSNIFIVYGFGLVPIALKLRSAQTTNNGEYRIEIGTSSTSLLATATSNLQLITNCDANPNRGIIETNSSELVFEEVGSYEGKFGGRVYAPTGSTLSLRIIFNEVHPELEGETPIVTLYKDGVKLRFQFGFSSEGEFPLEPDLQDKYPNIYIKYDFGFVYNSFIIRNGNSEYNGEYTLTISTQSRFGIANATTSVRFSGSSSAPSLRRGEGNIMVYSTGALNYSGLLGSSFIILSSTWNSIRIIAEDSNNNQDNSWEWYFAPVNGERRLIEESNVVVYTIIQSGNSSTLTILNTNEHLFGQYSVEVTNSAGSDSESSEINRIKTPMVKHEGSTTPPEGIIRIGEHVDITKRSELGDQSVVIEARDGTGFPISKTNWFYSEWKDGARKQIEASEHFEIISTPGVTRLVIRNATKTGFGYYFAMASNIAGINEARTILGQSPSLLTKGAFHFVRGFEKGRIGDPFIVRGNSQIAIEANARGFPPVSFTWFETKNPLVLHSYARKIMSSSVYMIGNTLNKSTLTQLVPIKTLIIKYSVRAMNELGKVEEFSYVVCG